MRIFHKAADYEAALWERKPGCGGRRRVSVSTSRYAVSVGLAGLPIISDAPFLDSALIQRDRARWT